MTIPATIEHHVPGRLRLRVAGGKRNPYVLDCARNAITGIQHTRNVGANLLTGSLVVLYEGAPEAFVRNLAAAGLRDARLPAVSNREFEAARSKAGTKWRKLAGKVLLGAGIAGVLLPVIPGTPFLIAGAAVLGSKDPLVARGAKWAGYARQVIRRFTAAP